MPKKVILVHELGLLDCCKSALSLLQEYRERVIKGEITGRLLEGDYRLVREMERVITKTEEGEV